MTLLRCLYGGIKLRTSRFMQLTSVCYTTFAAIAKVNMEVRAARSAKGKRRSYQHYSTATSPRFGLQIDKNSACIEAWLQQCISSFLGS